MDRSIDFDELFPGRFIKAGEFKGKDVTLTIDKIHLEDLPQDKGGEKTRGIISFRESKKQWVLNRTNAECLKAMWGRDTKDWIAKRVTLFPTMVQVRGGKELAVRVKGSPMLTETLEFEITLPRKKPVAYRLFPTAKTAPAQQTTTTDTEEPEL